MHQAVQADLPKQPLCSGKTEEEPTKRQTKIQKLIKYKGTHWVSEKRRKHLTEPKQSMAAQVILTLNHQDKNWYRG